MDKLLIITSGPTQLIYQLSTLELLNETTMKIEIIYNGLHRDSLDVFFQQLSVIKKFKYLGNINFDIIPKKSKNKTRLFNKYTAYLLNREVEKKFPTLKKYQFVEMLMMPVRVKVDSDITLLTYLKPKQVVLTADGVFDEFPKRNFVRSHYNYLDNILKRFPINKKVYSPNYLKIDISKIGSYKEISVKNEFQSILKIKLAKDFKQRYLNKNISCVIISQHFHLHEDISFEDDIAYYESIINYCLDKYDYSIIFKPHPRDTNKKIELLKLKFKNKIMIVDSKYQSLALEIFHKEFFKINTHFLTGNSSAPLFFKKTNKIFSVKSKKHLSSNLNDKIKLFSKKYGIKLIEV